MIYAIANDIVPYLVNKRHRPSNAADASDQFNRFLEMIYSCVAGYGHSHRLY